MKKTAIVLLLVIGIPSIASALTLTESGSSLIYPVAKIWSANYSRLHPAVVVTVESTGSGVGISGAVSGHIALGASDIPLRPEVRVSAGMLSIAVAQSAQVIVYNVPDIGTKHLNLSGDLLAGIYRGEIAYWNDPRIARANPTLGLPHILIVPMVRKDASGDTALFTGYLSAQVPLWKNSIGSGLQVTWPKAFASAIGNVGILAACAHTQGAIGYLGISYVGAANEASLGYAALLNHDKNYVLPSVKSLASAVDGLPKARASEDASLINRPGSNAYPITNFEYMIVKAKQSSAQSARALREFLSYVIDRKGGNDGSVLFNAIFMPLSDSVRSQSQEQISRIQ